MDEIWKDIYGYQRIYQVSNTGKVRNLKGEILKQQLQNSGYNIVHLYYNGKRKACTVHRLVAIAFIPNPDNLPQVNHIDGNKNNNVPENLEWCSKNENMQHAMKNGLVSIYERTDDMRAATGKRISKLMKGVSKSPEHNLKNSLSHKGIAPKCMRDKNRKDLKKVVCIETGIEYPTMKDAGESIGLNKNRMRRHLLFCTRYPEITLTYKFKQDVV